MDNFFRQCVLEKGTEYQYNKTKEECAELISAICQYTQGRIGPEEVRKEIADVRFMVNMMEELFDKEKCDRVYDKALERGRKRLEVWKTSG